MSRRISILTAAFGAAALLGACNQSTGGNTEKAMERAAQADGAQPVEGAVGGAPSTATQPAADDDRSSQPSGMGAQNSPGRARDGSQGNANNQDTGAPEAASPVEGQ